MNLPDLSNTYLMCGSIVIGAYAIYSACDPYWSRVRRRVRQLENADDNRVRSDDGAANSTFAERFVGEIQRSSPYHAAAIQRIQHRLAMAGVYDSSAVYRFYFARISLMSALAAVAIIAGVNYLIPMEIAIIAAIALCGLGFLIPGILLDRAIARRHRELKVSLPDFLDLMTVCLEGGLSLQDTIRRVSHELVVAHPSLASELAVVQRDVELGAPVDQALKRFATRSNCEGIRTLSAFMRESQRFGTNIADALRCHSDALRSKREQEAEENAQKASVKILIPTLLLIFPAIFVVLVAPAVIQIQEAFAVRN